MPQSFFPKRVFINFIVVIITIIIILKVLEAFLRQNNISKKKYCSQIIHHLFKTEGNVTIYFMFFSAVEKLFLEKVFSLPNNWPEPHHTGSGRWRPCSLYDQTVSCDQTPIADLDLRPQSWHAHQSTNLSMWWASFWLLVSCVSLLLSQPCITRNKNDDALTSQEKPRNRSPVNYHPLPSWRMCAILTCWVRYWQDLKQKYLKYSLQLPKEYAWRHDAAAWMVGEKAHGEYRE